MKAENIRQWQEMEDKHMKREIKNRTDYFRETENCSQETRQPMSEQLQILNEAQF